VTGGWRIAVRNLGRNRRRNLATGLAVALGYASLVVIDGYRHFGHEGLGALTVYLQHVGHLSIYKPGGLERGSAKPAEHAFTPEEQASVVAILGEDPRVELVGRHLRAGGLVGDGCRSIPFIATGVEPEVERRVLAHPRVRRWVPDRAEPLEGVALPEAGGAEPAVALAAGLARKVGKHPGPGAAGVEEPLDCASAAPGGGDPIVQLAAIDFEGAFNAIDARVTTVFRAVLLDEDNIALTAELAALQGLLATDRVGSFSVYLRDPGAAPAVGRDLAARLAAAGISAEIHAFDEPDANPYYAGTLQMLDVMLAFVGLLVVTVAALSMLNAMTLTILERTRELATFRSLGFTRGQVTGLFLREAMLLTAAGVAGGLLLGLAFSGMITAAGIRIEGSGMAGSVRLMLSPTLPGCVSAAAAYFPVSLLATWLAVRRSVARPVVHLLTAVTA
jgi:putative ABC transport system permease protein